MSKIANKRSNDRRSQASGGIFSVSELHDTLSELLLPITTTINVLNDTVAALIYAWNRKDTQDTTKKCSCSRGKHSDLSFGATASDLIASDVHRLAKSYSVLKDEHASNHKNLTFVCERLSAIEKILATLVKKQAKKVADSSCNFSPNPQVTTCAQSGVSESFKYQTKEEDYPQGSWLGDPDVPKSRVRCPLLPDDLMFINAKCTTPEKMALTLLDRLFSKETLSISNISGKSKLGKRQLDPVLIYGIKCHLIHIFSITETHWERIKLSIDSKCRTAWKKQRMAPEFCELYPDNSESKDSTELCMSSIVQEDYSGVPRRIIRTVPRKQFEVLAADQVLYNVEVLDEDHILPIISSDGEDTENTPQLVEAEDVELGSSEVASSFVMEPIMEVLANGGPLIAHETCELEIDEIPE